MRFILNFIYLKSLYLFKEKKLYVKIVWVNLKLIGRYDEGLSNIIVGNIFISIPNIVLVSKFISFYKILLYNIQLLDTFPIKVWNKRNTLSVLII